MESIKSHANTLRKELLGSGVAEAFFFAQAARDDVGEDADPPTVYAALEIAQDNLKRAPELLEALALSANAAISKLELIGHKGLGAWGVFVLPAKQQLAMYGLYLFVKARRAKRKPGHNNQDFISLLDLMWEAATGECEHLDWTWTDAIKSVRRSKPKPKRREPDVAYLNAMLDARDILSGMGRAARGFRKAQKSRLRAP